MIQWGRSLIFVVQMYAMMALMGLAFFPLALVSARGAVWACKTYCVWVRWTARWMVGIRSEVRGTVPTGEVIIAAKVYIIVRGIVILVDVFPMVTRDSI